MDSLISAIENYCPLSEEAKEAVKGNFEIAEVSKNEVLLKQGQQLQRLYFVETGLLRTHYLYEGKDITSWLFTEGQFAAAWYSFLTSDRSLESITAIENGTIYTIEKAKLDQLYDESVEVAKFGRLLMEEYVVFTDLYSKGYDFTSAQQRYDVLRTYFPELLQRVKQSHIASLLGISPETLSRLRAKIG